MSNSQISYLELIIGPMFSGKTTRLINIYNEKTAEQKKVKVVNYTDDTRYHNSMLSTHDKLMIPCVFANTIKEVCQEPEIFTYDVILINEGQFFPDLYDSVITLVEKHRKEVYICGLDGDFKRCKFGGLLDLIPMSDNVIKLHAKCAKCNKNAIFSKRLSNEEQQVLIGSSNYVPVCRDCYNC